jgi:uncharacterized protein (TIGR04255 family)
MSDELQCKTPPTDKPEGVIPERRYRKPPVVEALCEIYLADSAWDETVPGAFYEQVKDEFPQKRQREIQRAEISLGASEATAGVRRMPPWMQFVSEAKHRMIQIAKDLLVVNQLCPYPHFAEWEPEVYQALGIYRELALPKKVSRLGLRYINRVVIPEERVRMEDYFTIYPNLPPRLGNLHGSFMVRVEVPRLEQGQLVITFGTAPSPDPGQVQQAFMLDFYDILPINESIDAVDFKKEIQRAHDNIAVAFEDSITDRLRSLFEPEGQP